MTRRAGQLLLLLVVSACGSPKPTGPTVDQVWHELGGSASSAGISNNPTFSWSPVVALGADGNPIVAWSDSAYGGGNPEHIYIRWWDGVRWTELGEGSAQGGGLSGASQHVLDTVNPTMALDSRGRPCVAWIEEITRGSAGCIYLKRWDGSVWQELGGSASGTGLSGGDALALDARVAMDSADRPVVVWTRRTMNRNSICLRRWTGTEWAEVGGSASAGGISGSAQVPVYRSTVALAPGDKPVVAWTQESGGLMSDIRARRWTGDAWEDLIPAAGAGASLFDPGHARSPDVAINSEGNPTVLWVFWQATLLRHLIMSHSELHLRQWRGGVWAELGGSATDEGLSDVLPKPLMPQHVMDLPGAGIVISRMSGVGGHALVLDSEGNPVVAWTEYQETGQDVHLFARRWDGAKWVEIGVGSAAPGGIAHSPNIGPFSLAIGADDRLAVAWTGGQERNAEICVKVTGPHFGQDGTP
jgi:hypothetical protein